MKKLECIHADTCLSDYWGGHHLQHVQIAVWPGMRLGEVKQALKSELNQDAVAGSEYDPDDQNWHKKALEAVNRIKLADPKKRSLFTDLEPINNDCDNIVYAFFVFRPE